MRDDIRPALITNKPRFDNANFQSYDELISKAAKMKKKKNNHVKTRQRMFEKMSHKRGFVVSYKQVT